MLCTDIEIHEDAPREAFIKAWNKMVDHPGLLQESIKGDDLQEYRAREMVRLLYETGHIDSMPYNLMLKTLDHIEVGLDGSLKVLFLCGISINY
ncbi:MAG: hypothetical protein AB9844_06430 [Clostridiaceae bacterium]